MNTLDAISKAISNYYYHDLNDSQLHDVIDTATDNQQLNVHSFMNLLEKESIVDSGELQCKCDWSGEEAQSIEWLVEDYHGYNSTKE